jgi:arginyl-tRNA synthetase
MISMYPIEDLQASTTAFLRKTTGIDLSPDKVQIQPTRKEFEGHFTVVVFPLSGLAKTPPPVLAESIGTHLLENSSLVSGFSVVKGFLNLSLKADVWMHMLGDVRSRKASAFHIRENKKVVIEYASPNTNKPLHLGHIRNVLLGWSVSKIYEKAGAEVHRTQVVNDRGIAICKSMLAWKNFAEGETPQSSGIKGDHFVGRYYVRFEQAFVEEYARWQSTPEALTLYDTHRKEDQPLDAFFKAFRNRYFNEYSMLGKEARNMLRAWEEGDEDTVNLWRTMNGWVYDGFDKTYAKLGITFDSTNYESETYLLGKDMVNEGLEKGVFEKLDDGSVWADLTDVGLDRKIVLRSDGTSVYITQDLGTARQRYERYHMDSMIYTVADEQNYHFQALFEILKKMGAPYADGLYHLSYGMVDLPSGRMKSREGTVVDADDLIGEVIEEARKNAAERGEIEILSEHEQEDIIRKIGIAALKFQILKVDARKRTVFNPEESVDLQGQTGPYVQNAYVRIRSVLRKAGALEREEVDWSEINDLSPGEVELIRLLSEYPREFANSLEQHDPSLLANYAYDLAKAFHRFYHDHSILNAETKVVSVFRIELSKVVAETLKDVFDLLGIEMPDRM